MRIIHIANEKKRDAEVGFDVQPVKRSVRTVLPGGKDKINVRYLKNASGHSYELLQRDYDDPAAMAEALIESDPEVDMEAVGKYLSRTRKLWVDKDFNIAYSISLFQVVYNPDGTERERHDLNKVPGNVNDKFPIGWSGRLVPIREIIRKYVFTRQYQIRHINGATFDFLYNMAKELYDQKSMVLVGAGKRGSEPILLSRGGKPYRGFLEGRIGRKGDGECYALVLHLTDIELKGLPDAVE